MNSRISSSLRPCSRMPSMAIALVRSASAMSRDLSVSTIFFNRASLGTDSRTISPLRSINASTLLDVDRVMPKRRSTSCGKISRSEWRARKVMMSMLPPLRLSTSIGRVTARYRLMTLCSDRMATLGGLHAPRSHASVNAGFTEAVPSFCISFTEHTITRCTYNSCICNIQRVVCDGTGSQHTERNIVIAKSLKNSQK